MEEIFGNAESKMKKSIEIFQKELHAIRTGRANVAVLDGIKVDYYGQESPINQVAGVSVPDAKTIDVKPWEKKMLGEIEKAISSANLGMGITNTGESLKIIFPDLTEDTRKDMVKKVKKLGEESKVDVRNVRRDANEKVKDLEKNKEISQDDEKVAEGRVQKLTDKYIKNIDDIVKDKEKDLMTI